MRFKFKGPIKHYVLINKLIYIKVWLSSLITIIILRVIDALCFLFNCWLRESGLRAMQFSHINQNIAGFNYCICITHSILIRIHSHSKPQILISMRFLLSARSPTARPTWWSRRTSRFCTRPSCARSTVPTGTAPTVSGASSFTTSRRQITPRSSRCRDLSRVRLWNSSSSSRCPPRRWASVFRTRQLCSRLPTSQITRRSLCFRNSSLRIRISR